MAEVDAAFAQYPSVDRNHPIVQDMYNTLSDPTCLDDYMTVMCSNFFQSCSLDGPVMIPCRGFCSYTDHCVEHYFRVLSTLGLDKGELDLPVCVTFPYSSEASDQLCQRGKL